MQKNQAGKWTVFAFEDEGGTNPGEPVTGDAANITANIRIDGGAANAVDDTNPTELEDGYYIFDITATEANGDQLTLAPVSSTANVNVIGVPGAIYTTPANFNDLSVTATNGRVDVGEWLGTAVTTSSTTSKPEVDVYSVSDDQTAANNLELQYDSTGLTGDNFPATQAQVGQLSVGSASISVQADSYVLTTGTQSSGTVTDTETLDNVYHEHTDTAGAMELYYEFNVTTVGTASEATVVGRINGANDSLDGVYAWDWIGSAWDRVGDYNGQSSSTDTVSAFSLLTRHTGMGADVGKVRIRFYAASGLTSATLRIDKIDVAYAAIPSAGEIFDSGVAQAGGTNSITLATTASAVDDFYVRSKIILIGGTGAGQEAIITDYVGATKVCTVTPAWRTNPDTTSVYEVIPAQSHATVRNGGYDNAKVYVDVVNGSAGTLKGVNGTSTNPSDNLPDARTIADQEGIRIFDLRGGGAITLDQAYTNWIFDHVNAALIDMNSQDVTGSVFLRTGVTGIGTTTSRAVFELCGTQDITVGVANFLQTGFRGTTTLSATDRYVAWDCWENGVTTPIMNINGDGITATTLEMSNYSGRVEIQNMTSVDLVVITGQANVTLNANNTGGTLITAGDVKITDNSGNVTTTEGLIGDIEDDTSASGVAISSATANQIADHILRRALADARASSDGDTVVFRSIMGAMSKLCNRVAASATTLTIYEENDTSSFGTQTLTTDANADPITEVDTN